MDAKDEIKQRLNIEDVVGDYLELKRAGRNFKALSPFSHERTASFMVSPEKQIWHDFSSNKGGDIFSFVMEVEGIEFKEALEILAKKAGVELSAFQKQGNTQRAQLKKRLLEAHVLAAQYYHLCLSRSAPALSYIKEKRGFSPETIRTWQLGYAPETGRALYEFLKKRGFSETELTKAGLITKRRDGWGDMFRGRIMVPLADGQGNVVGFTARLLKDDKNAPKYFNTPQTLVYDKSRQVFGLHHAKEAIRKEDSAIIVEGNFDVIASHQAGVSNVVAAAGTAMTSDHLRSLSRLTLRVVLAFDADDAGLRATERAIPIAQAVGVELRVVSIPDGIKDPDELIAQHPDIWKQTVQNADDAVTWILKRYEKLYDARSAEGKRQLSSKALDIIGGLQDPVEVEHHVKKLSKYLDVSVDSLVTKLRQSKRREVSKKSFQAVKAEPDTSSYIDDFLALNAYFPEVRDSLQNVSAVFFNANRETVKEALKKLGSKRIETSDATRLNLNEDYVKILLLTAEEKYASWTPADIMAETMALARRITAKSKQKDKSELTSAIREAEQNGDSQKAAQLLDEYQQLLKGE